MICRFGRNQCLKAVPSRSSIDAGRKRWKDGGGHSTDVMFVPRDVSGQGHWHQNAHPRAGPVAISGLLASEGAGTGGEPVLQQVPGQNPEASQVR